MLLPACATSETQYSASSISVCGLCVVVVVSLGRPDRVASAVVSKAFVSTHGICIRKYTRYMYNDDPLRRK